MWASLGSEEARSAESAGRRGGRLGRYTVSDKKGRDTSAPSSSSKKKGRPKAAGVEITTEDIRSSEDFQGTPGWNPEAIRFLFA
jgi:hypothetical protein